LDENFEDRSDAIFEELIDSRLSAKAVILV